MLHSINAEPTHFHMKLAVLNLLLVSVVAGAALLAYWTIQNWGFSPIIGFMAGYLITVIAVRVETGVWPLSDF